MLKRKQKQLHILVCVITVLTILGIVISFIGGTGERRMVDPVSIPFDDSWVVKTQNGDAMLDTSHKIKQKPGENVIISNRLPNQLPDNCVLLVESRFTHFELQIGDMVVYQCDQNANHTVGREPFPGFYMISIPAGYQGQQITLSTASDYAAYAGYVGTLLFGSRGDVLWKLAGRYLPGFCAGILMIVLSLILFLLKGSMASITKRKYELTYVAMLLLLSGGFLVVQNGLLRLVCKQTQGLYISAILLLLLIPFYYDMYLYTIVDRRAVRRFINWALIVQIVSYVAACVFVGLGIVDAVIYGMLLIGLELFMLAAITFILLAAAVKYKQSELTYHGTCNIVFFIFLIFGAAIRYVDILRPYQDVAFGMGILIWCLLMMFHAEGRLADTMQGELNLERRALAEYKERTLHTLMPDSLFGGLHVLLDMMKRREPDAMPFLVRISDYLRGRLNMLRYEESRMIPFEEECSHMLGCLEIAMHRTQNFSYQTEFKVQDFYVPAFTLEAFVENAVKYGVGTREHPAMISVKSYETAKEYAVQIADTGVGFDVEHIVSDGEYGIASVTKRLSDTAGAFVDIRSREGKGTVVTVKFPKQKQTEYTES